MPVLARALLSLREVMTVTGLSESTIRKEMRAQNLPGRLMNGKRRFLVSDVEKYIGAPLPSLPNTMNAR
jgi:predicted DNA-binding transcriptional regulator AlpA